MATPPILVVAATTINRAVMLTIADQGSAGLVVKDADFDNGGVVVAEIEPNSPAALSQRIFVGDKILEVSGDSTEGMDFDVVQTLLNSGSVRQCRTCQPLVEAQPTDCNVV
jgi:S1-C subfamily serine protease